MSNGASSRCREKETMDTIHRMQELIYSDSLARVVSTVSGQDIVIFLGNTKSGKSTLINHILGTHLKAQQIREDHYSLAKRDVTSSGPPIGSLSISETTVPTTWSSSKISGLVIDTPGIDDNRGEAQDVANAFYIKELVKNAKSVKFVLVIDINDILSDNVTQFVNFVGIIHNMLQEKTDTHRGMAFVFNKSRVGITKEFVCNVLNEKIIQCADMQVENRPLVNYMVHHIDQMVLVNTPSSEGAIDDSRVFGELIDVIEHNTGKLLQSELPHVTPGISYSSRVFLFAAHNLLSEWKDLDDILKAVHEDIPFILNEFSLNNNNMEEMKDSKRKLQNLEDRVNASLRDSSLTSEDILLNLSELLPRIEGLQKRSVLYTKLNFVSFVDEILEIEESSIFRVKLDAIVSYMLDRLTQCRITLQERMLEISHREAEQMQRRLMEDNHRRVDETQREVLRAREVNENTLNRLARGRRGNFFQRIGIMIDYFVDIFINLRL